MAVASPFVGIMTRKPRPKRFIWKKLAIDPHLLCFKLWAFLCILLCKYVQYEWHTNRKTCYRFVLKVQINSSSFLCFKEQWFQFLFQKIIFNSTSLLHYLIRDNEFFMYFLSNNGPTSGSNCPRSGYEPDLRQKLSRSFLSHYFLINTTLYQFNDLKKLNRYRQYIFS